MGQLYLHHRINTFYVQVDTDAAFDGAMKSHRAGQTLAFPFMGKPDASWQPVETYRVPEANIRTLEKRMEKLQRAAQKIGAVAPEIFYVSAEMVDHPRLEGVQMKVFELAVIGETPRLNGWRFLAAIQHRRKNNIINTPPWLNDAVIPDRYRTAEAWCEHCHMKRDRRDTYLVIHENGDIKQVGKNCLADFTGHASPQALAAHAELLFASVAWLREATDDDLDSIPVGDGGGAYLGLRHFLAVVAHMVSETGFVPRGQDLQLPTADAALSAIVGPGNERIVLGEADFVLADKALAWGRGTILPKTDKTNFEWNMAAILDDDLIACRETGIAAALVPMYQRAMEQEAMRGAEAGSRFVGELHKRHAFDWLMVIRVIPMGGFYGGTTWLTKMRDRAGNVLIWFSSAEELVPHAVYAGTARVEAHEPYKGVNQTRISRAKLVMVEPPPFEEWPRNEFDVADLIDKNLKSGATWTVAGSTLRRDGEWNFYLDEEERQDMDAIVNHFLQIKENL
ncbi:MAG: hypothetical protein FOGNACKC_00859 [Anaerolineae bacterium]|nr:hypothetical protein [Anaerolineae bacterium]